jgi:hypothetical protein
MTTMSQQDLVALKRAKHLLEHVGFATSVANTIGKPVEWAISRLPTKVRDKVMRISHNSIAKGMDYACRTLPANGKCHNHVHKICTTATGAVGGFFGFKALAVELPVSTILMLRSIGEIARSHGELLDQPEARLACMQVFALGGNSSDDDAMDNAYLAFRAALANEMRMAAAWLAEGVGGKKSQPALVKLIQTIATRFGIVVEEKLVAQAIPVIGAVGGAAINLTFIDHFQDKAEGHFIFRQMERKYGAQTVESAYRHL